MKKIVTALLLCSIALMATAQSKKALAAGDKVPAFQLRDQDGNLVKSADYTGKHSMVIFFYPKDESLVCTKEACSFRDNYEAFQKAGAMIFGINGGTTDSHKSFQRKERLPFPLLSDPDNKVLKAFGVPNKFFMTGRKTFVVNKQGNIVFTYDSSLKGAAHAEETLAYLTKKG